MNSRDTEDVSSLNPLTTTTPFEGLVTGGTQYLDQDNQLFSTHYPVMSSSNPKDPDAGLQYLSWGEWFNRAVMHVSVPVEESFIEDNFNLTNLPEKFRNYSRLMEIILDYGSDDDDDDTEELDAEASTLYSLIHQRYVLTASGLEAARNKYAKRKFPRCPRLGCAHTQMIPHGLSDAPGRASLHFLCPSCDQVYMDRAYKTVDGCLYGTSFAAFFMITYAQWLGERVKMHIDTEPFSPTLFGYKIHPTSPYFYKKPEEEEVQAEAKDQNLLM